MPSPCNLNPPGEPSFNELLIATVRKYPALYSNQRRAFENVDRNKIWEEIAAKVGRGVTGEFAKKRWLQLRDRYRKELKLSIARNFTQPQKWTHFQLLNWLDPYLQGAIPVATNSAPSYTLDRINTTGNSDAFYEDFAAKFSFVESPPNGNEPSLSDCFEDVIKPAMSTLQSVLAVAEATANMKKAEITGKEKDMSKSENIYKNIDDCNTVSSNIVATTRQHSSGSPSPSCEQASTLDNGDNCKNTELSGDCSVLTGHSPGLQGSSELSLMEAPNSTLSSCSPEIVLEPEDVKPPQIRSYQYHGGIGTVSNTTISQHSTLGISAPVVSKVKATNALALKALSHGNRGSPYRLAPVFSNVRFRARNIKKQKQQQQLNLTKTLQTSSTAGTNFMCSDWINDEEMLFARIVGLRLKKMDSIRRRSARMRILQILDNSEEEIIEDGE